MNIVIIDNNFALRQALGSFIRNLGKELKTEINVYTAQDGVEGLGLIYVTAPDIILIDTTLPRYSGKEVIDFLVDNHSLQQSQTPVIVIQQEADLLENLPTNFTPLYKVADDFLLNLSKHIYKVAGQDVIEKKFSFLARICELIIKISNNIDIRANSEKESINAKVRDLIIWFLGEFVLMISLAFIYMFYGKFKDESIQQRNIDTISHRVKYLPVLSMALLTALLVGLNTSINIALFNNTIEDAKAAGTFTVDSTSDTSDFSAGDGVCDTNDGVGDGPCTLRAAIEESVATYGVQNINFNIAGSGPFTLTPNTRYPNLGGIVIDGYTQPGSSPNSLPLGSGNNANIQIVIDGSNLPTGGFDTGIFTINSSTTTIKGIVFNNIQEDGIELKGGIWGEIKGNFFGTDSTGLITVGSGDNGIRVHSTGQHHTIGGTDPADFNILGGSTTGIFVDDSSENITIQGNYIGLGADGSTVLSNSTGVDVQSSNTIYIGTSSNGNIISGNTGNGIILSNTDIVDIEDNIIGLAANGIANKGNGIYGINAGFSSNIDILGNTISSNGSGGVLININNGISIKSNIIGMSSDGLTPRGNTGIGIHSSFSNSNITIGGVNTDYSGATCSGECNIISSNTSTGIMVSSSASSAHTIQGNFIGVAADAGLAGNGAYGINIQDSDSHIIGGSNPGEGNIVKGNNIGLYIYSSDSNTITGNEFSENIGTGAVIGTSFTNTITDNAFDSNGSHGVNITEGGWNSTLTDNSMSYNTSNGIYIVRGVGNQLGGNTITNNGINGIYLYDNVYNTTIDNNTISENTQQGINIGYGSSRITITDNTINSNTLNGIKLRDLIDPNNMDRIDIRGNSIYDNDQQGIELGNDGQTANDAEDSDTGENGLQNYPVITSVITQDSDTNIDFSLDTVAGDYLIEFFENSTQDSSGYGEGENMFCSDTITHGGTGSEDFSINCTTDPTANYFITATATIDNGGGDYDDTSEFSSNNVISNHAPVAVNDSTSLNTNTSKTINVKANDSDPNGSDDIVSLNITLDAINGSTQIISGKVKYTPDTDFSGNDSFKYEICDASSLCDEATVSITVISPTNTPTPSITPTSSLNITTLPTSSQPSATPSSTITPSPTKKGLNATSRPTARVTTPANIIKPTKKIVTPANPNIQLGYTPQPSYIPSPTNRKDSQSEEQGGEKDSRSIIQRVKEFGEKHKGTSSIMGIALAASPVVITSIGNSGVTLYGLLWFVYGKRRKPWGIVYDRSTQKPIAFASIYAIQNGKNAISSVSNLDGKYQILPEPGRYSITIKHPDYQSQTKSITIDKQGAQEFIEFALTPKSDYSRSNLTNWIRSNLYLINTIIFTGALLYSAFITVINPSIINQIILIVFLIQLAVFQFVIRKRDKPWGLIKDIAGRPVSHNFIRLLQEDTQVDVTISNLHGAYSFLATGGEYRIQVDNYQIVEEESSLDDVKINLAKDQAVNKDLVVDKKADIETSQSPF